MSGLGQITNSVENCLIPALVAYLEAIFRLSTIFTLLHRDTQDVQNEMERAGGQMNVKKGERLYRRVTNRSATLEKSMVAVTTVFNNVSADFAGM